MSRLVALRNAAALLVCVAGLAHVHAEHRDPTLAVIMTNDAVTN